MRIDAHHHFWHPARGDYGWMPDDDPILSRPYAPSDLASARAQTGVDRTILVQAAPTVCETEYLLGIADATEHVAGVVGWVDFENRNDFKTLERLSQHPKLLGLRPMIQDIPDVDWMLRDEIDWAYRALTELDLTFDALGFPRHLQNFHVLLIRHPDLRVVLDHAMKPRINTPEAFAAWATGMTRLAKETNAFCKISGLVTEAETDWSIAALQPYVDHLLEVFGPERLMWGSDWPVCRLKCEYNAWFDLSMSLTNGLDEAARDRVFGGTAADFYRLKNEE